MLVSCEISETNITMRPINYLLTLTCFAVFSQASEAKPDSVATSKSEVRLLLTFENINFLERSPNGAAKFSATPRLEIEYRPDQSIASEKKRALILSVYIKRDSIVLSGENLLGFDLRDSTGAWVPAYAPEPGGLTNAEVFLQPRAKISCLVGGAFGFRVERAGTFRLTMHFSAHDADGRLIEGDAIGEFTIEPLAI